MKKLTSDTPITFKVTSARVLEINADGVLASDAEAAIVTERLGQYVTVTDVDAPEPTPEETPEPAPAPVPDPLPEPMPTPSPVPDDTVPPQS